MRYTVQVKPGSKKGPLVTTADDGSLVVHLRERPVDGAANDGLIKILADHFGVAKSGITIESGHTARIKRVRVSD